MGARYSQRLLLSVSEQVKTPVVDQHEVSRGILELTLLDQRETKLATNGVRSGVQYRGECMQDLVPVFQACLFYHSFSSFRRDTTTLICSQDKPACFIEQLFPPGFFPKAYTANGFGVGTPNDLEHVVSFWKPHVTLVTLKKLLRALGPTERRHHVGVAQELFQERQIVS
jgi:hypothetical protein